ncbi:MAG: head-tail adaptor protein [Bacilli bacterium]|nr:head-tail adaptor protein [Bacilli bacterium]
MLGSMNKKARIIRLASVKDAEGFTSEKEEIVADIRCYKEGRHGSEKWANLAAFSEATDLFRFRAIPHVKVDERMLILFEGERYDILSVENIKGRGMYLEALARVRRPVDGKV